MDAELIFFLFLAVVAVASALALIFTRTPVYAVLLMVLNFAVVAILFLTLGATFLAAVQIIVYAGAILVLFLFVVMLMGPGQAPLWEHLPGQRPLSLLFGILLLVGLVMAVNVTELTAFPGEIPEEVMEGESNPLLVSQVLYSDYALPFEVTSILLLIAMIGAVTIARRRGQEKLDLPSGAVPGAETGVRIKTTGDDAV